MTRARHPEADTLVASWAITATPPPELTVSEWADQVRKLPATSAARGGKWRTEAVPYLRGIMDAVHEPGVRRVALMKCHQSGGSEALHNILGYHIEHNPCAMLFVHPTAMVAEAWSKERLSDMIRSTPALRKVVRDGKPPKGSHEAESTLALKMFPGGYLALGGANSPNTFARWSVRLAIGDDVDRFPPVVGDEGDPADLLENRTTSFHDALTIFVSTPTLKNGRIDVLYQRSDQRRFFVPCLCCEREDWITWNDPKHFRVVFEERDPQTAQIACPDAEYGGCGARFSEPDRRAMVARGAWRPTAIAQDVGLIGFHLPSMIATLGDVTLPRLVEKWLTARAKGKESLRVFINQSLAEGWEDRGARMDSHVIMERREDYGEDIEVPAAAAALTCGVDSQDDRFELQVLAWGPALERWVVDYRVIPGNTKLIETRAALLEALTRKYRHASGVDLPILATCIDSAGHATNEVYDFVLQNQWRRILATIGRSGKSGEPIMSKPTAKRYGRSPRPVPLYTINVDDAKADVMNSLSLLAPGPGYMHFSARLDTITEEYCAQLCAEHRETRYNKFGVATHSVWVADRERNEGLDTAVGALAAWRWLNQDIRQLAAGIARAAADLPKAAAKPTKSGAPTPSGAPPPASGRRVIQSSYLQR